MKKRREIKFRYVFKHNVTGKVLFRYWTIEQIEQGSYPIFFEFENYTLVSKDQSTGFRDSKSTKEFPVGQEIYEGDIVKVGDETYRIYYEDGYACYWLATEGGSLINGSLDIELIEYYGGIHVIGNIYELVN
jgi:hypothetical protein